MKLLIPVPLFMLALSVTGCVGIGRALPVTLQWKSDETSEPSEQTDESPPKRLPDAPATMAPKASISDNEDFAAKLGVAIEDPLVLKALTEVMTPGAQDANASGDIPSVRKATSTDKSGSSEPPAQTDKTEVSQMQADELQASALEQRTLPSPDSQTRSLDSTSPNNTSPIPHPSAIADPRQSGSSNSAEGGDVGNTEPPAETQPTTSATGQANSPSVRDSSTSLKKTAETPKPAPGVWKQELGTLIRMLEEQLRDHRDTLHEAEREHLATVLAMLYLVANDRSAALETVEDSASDKDTFWKELIYAMSVVMERDDLDVNEAFFTGDHRRAAIALDHLRKAHEGLSPIASLQVKNISLCEEVTGYGNYQPFSSRTFKPGQQTIVYCEIENYLAEQVIGERGGGQQFESEFRSSISIYDENRKVLKQIEYQPIVDRGRNRRRDFYIHYTMTVPDNLPKGTYFIALQVEDVKAGKAASSPPLEFRVR